MVVIQEIATLYFEKEPTLFLVAGTPLKIQDMTKQIIFTFLRNSTQIPQKYKQSQKFDVRFLDFCRWITKSLIASHSIAS